MLKFYNTLSRKKEIFKPLKTQEAGLYACGPTVYDFAHIGNLRTYIFEDFTKRVLKYNDYKVKHVINITDVGHLTSDADTGEDKLEKGAKREGKTAWQIASFYTKVFKKDIKLLNIKSPDVWIKATETIKEQINLIKILEKKGFTYKIEDGIYFDTSKLKNYGRLWPKKMKIKAGARVAMVSGKKSPTDFALWKLTSPGVKRQMEWSSPWGRGFPGWHTECVVMSQKTLGVPFDIHFGGIDHILIHHTNEIAQSDAAFEKPLARFWLHGEFLTLKQSQMGKSKGNIITIQSLIEKKLNPLAFRYLCLTAHYRSKLNFSWTTIKGAQRGLDNLYQKVRAIKTNIKKREIKQFKPEELKVDKKIKKYQSRFLSFINDDLDLPKALALIWQLIKDEKIANKEKYALLLDFDTVLGLGLDKIKKEKIPKEILELVKKREEERQKKDWLKTDKIRIKIKQMGYLVEDTKQGPKVKKL